jgi:peptide/nickel transport system permease protein
MTGLVIVLALVVIAILPAVANHTAALRSSEDRLQPMSWAHPFGTDELGRDIYARVIFGSRICRPSLLW